MTAVTITTLLIGGIIAMFTRYKPAQSIISGDEFDCMRVQRSEQSRKRKPTEGEIVLLRQYLRDFKIKTTIPSFSTVAEMESWKIKQVKNKFGR